MKKAESSSLKWDFIKTLNEANSIDNITERKLFLKKNLKEFKQSSSSLESWYIDIEGYEAKVKEEIIYVEELEKTKINVPQLQPNNITPIWWQKSNRLLGYLIEELSSKGFIDRNTDINKMIKQHFVDTNKEPFNNSIAQNRSGSGSNKGTTTNKENKPRGHNDIDNIISDLKKIKEE